ncbi:MAG: hypothetical protein AB1690_09700 [Candidatus Zixiibacteriota bacterium]
MNRRVTTGRLTAEIDRSEERPGNCDGGRLVRGLPAVVAGTMSGGRQKKSAELGKNTIDRLRFALYIGCRMIG